MRELKDLQDIKFQSIVKQYKNQLYKAEKDLRSYRVASATKPSEKIMDKKFRHFVRMIKHKHNYFTNNIAKGS